MPDTVEPKFTLRDLGYAFNKKGELRSISDDEPFKFTTQEDYEALGDAMTHEVYNLLESVGLQRVVLKKPTDTKSDEEYSFVFVSPEFDTKDTVLLLVHGTGVVRAGQWTRKLILNENLDRGSQLPYIERALALGWGVIVSNCNNNAHYINNKIVPLTYSKCNEMHIMNIYYRFIRFARCSRIHVVAHSRGGGDISFLLDAMPSENRFDIICLTDSWFEFSRERTQQPIVINWAARPKHSLRKPVDGDRISRQDKVYQVWAGTTEHERSSCMAIDSIFYVLESRPCKENIDRILVDAWDIMDPPQLDAIVSNNVDDDTDDDDMEEKIMQTEGVLAAQMIQKDEDDEEDNEDHDFGSLSLQNTAQNGEEQDYYENISVDIESVVHEEVIETDYGMDHQRPPLDGSDGDFIPQKRPRSNAE